MDYNKVYNLDVIEGLKKIEDNSIDLIICDPPYFEIYGDFDFVFKDLDDYLNWCKKWIMECNRVLKKDGSFYLWGKIGFNKGYPLFKLMDWIEENKLFKVINWITQRNTRGRGTKKGYMEAREELIFMTKSENYKWNTAYTDEKSNRKDLGFDGKPRKNKFKRCSDVWIDITEASQSSKQRFKDRNNNTFPTTKALKLCDRIIQSSSNENDIVLVPFVGSGSECVSAIINNRNFIGFEKNELYWEIAIKRISETLK